MTSKSTPRSRPATPAQLCIVGCGAMGMRHIRGLAALRAAGLVGPDLAGVCDRNADKRRHAADLADALLGSRPQTFDTIEAVLRSDIQAIDVVTNVAAHLTVAVAALNAGRDVLCEKPLALTVRACDAIRAAADRGGGRLSVAHNLRRDPPNRLAKAIIDAGLLGEIYLMDHLVVGGTATVIGSPWRHRKHLGAVGLDVGVHVTDLIGYLLGHIERVYGRGFIAEPLRYSTSDRQDDSDVVHADGEDSIIATYELRSGATARLVYIPSGSGRRQYRRTIYGRQGSLELFEDRTGTSPILRTETGERQGAALEKLVPRFALDDATQALFGSSSASYEGGFRRADAALIALELHEFACMTAGDVLAEVDGTTATRAVAALLAAYESGLVGRPVSVTDVMTGVVSAYQDDIDRAAGLLGAA